MMYAILIMLMSMISISSKNTISMWYYLEMTSFTFIFYMIKKNNPNKSPMIYFIMSFLSSLLIMMSISLSNFNSMEMSFSMLMTNMNSIMMSMAFLLKMGAIPFHSWVFSISENMEWTSMMMMFSIQKIIPIWGISCFSKMKILLAILLISVIISPFLPMKSKNSFFLISTSSMINNLWIIMASTCSVISSSMYSIIYFISNTNFIYILKKNNTKTVCSGNPSQTTISILSLMGFPPTPNFFIKMMVVKNMLLNQNNMLFMAIMILINNMMSSMMYMKMLMMPAMDFKNLINKKYFSSNSNKINFMINMSPMVFMMAMNFN